MDYLLIATLMRAVRLYSFMLSMGIMWWWSPSLFRRLRGRPPRPVLVRSSDTPVQIALDRERARAIWTLLAFGVFLIQLRWLSPWLPDAWKMRLWITGIASIDAVMLAAIFHHGRVDPRFHPRRAAIAWSAILVLCALFAVVSA